MNNFGMNQSPNPDNKAELTPEQIKELKDKFTVRIGFPPRLDMPIKEIQQGLIDEIEEVRANMRLKELDDSRDTPWGQR